MATLGEKEEQFADLREKRVKVMSDKIKIQAMIRYGKNLDSGPGDVCIGSKHWAILSMLFTAIVSTFK